MKKVVFTLLVSAFLFQSCSVVSTLRNLSRLQFKLNSANNIQVAGINVMGKTKLSDFSAMEILSISSSFAKGTLPLTFTLNVEAKNPNDGTTGNASTSATINSFPYRLNINNKDLLSGNIGAPVNVPGTGQVTIIPLQMTFDLAKSFQDGSYQDLLNVALQILGVGKGSSNIQLYAKPTVGTTIGNITYPGELKIVDLNYTN
ncbi:MAG: hypothetical protein AB9882_03500 [Ignavibacteriaceae bacterium]